MQSLFSRLALPWASSSDTGSAKQTPDWSTSADASTASTSSGPTLSGHGQMSCLPSIANLPETRRLVVTTALNHLFNERHFSICTLDRVLDTMQGTQKSDAYKLLRTLHCVDYAAMPPELRNSIPTLVNEALRPPMVACVATDVALQGVVL